MKIQLYLTTYMTILMNKQEPCISGRSAKLESTPAVHQRSALFDQKLLEGTCRR